MIIFNGKTQISGQLKNICMGDSNPKYRLRLYKTVPFLSLTANRLLHAQLMIAQSNCTVYRWEKMQKSGEKINKR